MVDEREEVEREEVVMECEFEPGPAPPVAPVPYSLVVDDLAELELFKVEEESGRRPGIGRPARANRSKYRCILLTTCLGVLFKARAIFSQR